MQALRSTPLALFALLAGCSAFPEVTYAEDEEIEAITSGEETATTPGVPAAAEADAGADANAAPIPSDPSEPPDAGSGPGPGPGCHKGNCVGTACDLPSTCDRCKDACKGRTKKCCADVDPVNAGGLALSCVADDALCPGESP